MPPHQRCVSQTGPSFSLGRRPSLRPRTLDCSRTVIRSQPVVFLLQNDLYCVGWGIKLYSLTYSLSLNALHLCHPCKYVNYYLITDSGEWKAQLA